MAYHQMSADEIREFLTSEPPRTGILGTVRADGRPHVAPVWFDVDDDGTIVFNTSAESVKGRNLTRTGTASICVDEDRPPFSFVTVDGPVELSDDPDDLLRWATRIGGRYMGADQAEAYGARNAVPPELVVRLRPKRVTSAKDVAS